MRRNEAVCASSPKAHTGAICTALQLWMERSLCAFQFCVLTKQPWSLRNLTGTSDADPLALSDVFHT